MGTNSAPLVGDLILFCYERDFMMSLSDDKQADVIDAFNTTSRYLDDILNINNVYFDNMVSQIYPSELQLSNVCLFVCCFTSQVNGYGHGGTVSSPNHTFSWANLNKQLTSTSCTYFRL